MALCSLAPVPDVYRLACGHVPGTNHEASGAPLVAEAQRRITVRQPAIDVALRKDLFRRSVTGRERAFEFL
jgi:hypothetical protein